ncbi:hypothetical protein RDI58_011978 [Solanum bulbocastanum]|uniref:Uncharacterized protein n=1 Tax=Solanum bulbocastanum TaxID=147425 RepID=A0AAN8YHU7_SOLBU
MSIVEHKICSVFIDLWRLELKFQQPRCYPRDGSTFVRKRFIDLIRDARTIQMVPRCNRSNSCVRLSSAEGDGQSNDSTAALHQSKTQQWGDNSVCHPLFPEELPEYLLISLKYLLSKTF